MKQNRGKAFVLLQMLTIANRPLYVSQGIRDLTTINMIQKNHTANKRLECNMVFNDDVNQDNSAK